MATSGSFLTSDSGQGGGNYFGRLIFEWWRTDWGRSGSSGYHNISYTLKSYGGSSGYWQYTYNTSMNVDGTGYSRGQTQTYGAGATTLLSGSKTLWTDSVGNRSFGASAQSGIYTASINTSGSGSWSMDNIPMYGDITNTSGNFNDSNYNPWIEFSNPAGGSTQVWFELPSLTGSTRYAQRNSVGSRYTWTLTETEMNAIRSAMANTNSTTIRYKFANYVGGWVERNVDRTISIVNANPVFSIASYEDANASTVAITGNDQYLIQGYSELEVEILSANKATAQKSASMVKYNMAIGSINQDVTYSTSDIAQNLGTLGINANANLTVKAIDSRNNQTSVVLPVNVLPYVAPQITATAQRVNNFETETDFHIEAVISRLTIADVDKNTVNAVSGVRYRYKKTTDASWGSWINKASTVTAGNVSVADFTLTTELDRNFAWNIQVEVTDKLATSTLDLLLSVGIPVFRIGLDGHVYNNEQPLMPSHVGQIIQSTTLTTAEAVAEIYGGTWVAWGVGRSIVGVDTSQTEFDTVEETGGAKTHTLTNAQLPVLTGDGQFKPYDSFSTSGIVTGKSWAQTKNFSAAGGAQSNTTLYGFQINIGGGQAHNNLHPYITAYQWKRTA